MLRAALLATLLVGVLLSLPLTACTSPRAVAGPGDPAGPAAGGDSTRAALDAARARWQDAGLEDYRFVYEVSCFCPEEARGPFSVTVRDGAVQEVRYQGRPIAPDAQRTPTVDALLAMIEDAFDQDAEVVRVTYDAALGFPAEAYVDYEAMMADEELRFWIRDFAPLGG